MHRPPLVWTPVRIMLRTRLPRSFAAAASAAGFVTASVTVAAQSHAQDENPFDRRQSHFRAPGPTTSGQPLRQ